MDKDKVLHDLQGIRRKITPQAYRTIQGQIRAGDLNGASVGIERIKRKMLKKTTKK